MITNARLEEMAKSRSISFTPEESQILAKEVLANRKYIKSATQIIRETREKLTEMRAEIRNTNLFLK